MQPSTCGWDRPQKRRQKVVGNEAVLPSARERSQPVAAPGDQAEPLYDRFCDRAGAKKGVFGACMGVALVNDGPVTVMLEV